MHILQSEGFEPFKITHHATEKGVSRYIHADRIVREQVVIRVSDHRTDKLDRRTFSVIWKRPGRVWEIRKWIHSLQTKIGARHIDFVTSHTTPTRVLQHAASASSVVEPSSKKEPPVGNTGGKQA